MVRLLMLWLLLSGAVLICFSCSGLDYNAAFTFKEREGYLDKFMWWQQTVTLDPGAAAASPGFYVVKGDKATNKKWGGRILVLQLKGRNMTPEIDPYQFTLPADLQAKKPEEVKTLVFTQLVADKKGIALELYLFDVPSGTFLVQLDAREWPAGTDLKEISRNCPPLMDVIGKWKE